MIYYTCQNPGDVIKPNDTVSIGQTNLSITVAPIVKSGKYTLLHSYHSNLKTPGPYSLEGARSS